MTAYQMDLLSHSCDRKWQAWSASRFGSGQDYGFSGNKTYSPGVLADKWVNIQGT